MAKRPEESDKLIYAEAKFAVFVVGKNLPLGSLERISRKNFFHGAEDCNPGVHNLRLKKEFFAAVILHCKMHVVAAVH